VSNSGNLRVVERGEPNSPRFFLVFVTVGEIAFVYAAFCVARHFQPQGVSSLPAKNPKERSGRRFEEDVMQWHKSVLKSILGKAALAADALSGFMFFGGASSAQAAPVYIYHRPVARYYVGHGYRRPVADYWRYEHRVYARGFYDRFGCWHRY